MSNKHSITIIVAAHKPYWMPRDEMYFPVQAGSMGKNGIPGFQRDDDGNNISAKNKNYCELTALYWAWKNLAANYIGLAHYRRHFAGEGERGTLSQPEAQKLLAKKPVLLPKKRTYYIETLESHYGHTFNPEHIENLQAAIERISPEYMPAFRKHMASTSAHMFNMFIMRQDLLDEYCDWMFRILNAVEQRIDFEGMTDFEARCIGRLSEYLLDTWISYNHQTYAERKVIDIEPVNWLKKGGSFLAAKFFGHKYSQSF